MSADAVDIHFGVSNTTFVEQNIKRLMLEAAKQVALVCDHTKFGNTALAKVCRLDELEHIITDEGISPSLREEMERLGLLSLLCNVQMESLKQMTCRSMLEAFSFAFIQRFAL
ncbi:DeoR/GlpR family DNA-binding transcription regulator [Cohnella faecalis]|uniref:DeoR/GlpR transcriptional regulator n=1 Tax=Cohnella faecalis TaxID=2315694 RepID=A0A398CVR5_9BACL|nr:DeoR/GlpR family DNA-binding transcription regulator [Cohnella faecalis]RIE03114.1 DeoR/GlpR transcriptional regulator [Cohnella faecalis]